MLTTVFEAILANNLAQPRGLRASRLPLANLMVTEQPRYHLISRTACKGSVTYDLASLFKDAYIAWDEERVIDWVVRYWEKARTGADCR